MKEFKDLLADNELTEASLSDNIQQDIDRLEAVIKRYESSSSFMIKQLKKAGLGDFTSEGKQVADMASEALMALAEVEMMAELD